MTEKKGEPQKLLIPPPPFSLGELMERGIIDSKSTLRPHKLFCINRNMPGVTCLYCDLLPEDKIHDVRAMSILKNPVNPV